MGLLGLLHPIGATYSFSPGFLVIDIAIYVFVGYCMGKAFEKAGRPMWAGFVPFYNTYLLVEIIGRPVWWFIVMVVCQLLGVLVFPLIAAFVFWLLISLDVAKSYGRSTGFGIGLTFLPFVFYPILGLGPATYLGPAGAQSGYGQPGYGPMGYQQPGYPPQAPPPGYPPQGPPQGPPPGPPSSPPPPPVTPS